MMVLDYHELPKTSCSFIHVYLSLYVRRLQFVLSPPISDSRRDHQLLQLSVYPPCLRSLVHLHSFCEHYVATMA